MFFNELYIFILRVCTRIKTEWKIFLIFLVIFLFVYIVFRIRRRKCNFTTILKSVLIAYVACLFVSMVFSRHGRDYYQLELRPLHSYCELFVGHKEYLVQNMMNIVAFIPVGLIFSVLEKRYMLAFFSGVGISLLIELLQLIMMKGVFEIDDIINNAVGTLIGVLITFVILRLKGRRID